MPKRRTRGTSFIENRFNDLLRCIGGQKCKNIDFDHIATSDGYLDTMLIGMENKFNMGKLEYFYIFEQSHGCGTNGQATRKKISNQPWCSSHVAQTEFA